MAAGTETHVLKQATCSSASSKRHDTAAAVTRGVGVQGKRCDSPGVLAFYLSALCYVGVGSARSLALRVLEAVVAKAQTED